jgi:hypothetical protein
MQIHQDRLPETPATPDEGDELLQCRMTIVGLHSGAVERDYGEAFDKIKRRCATCRARATCAADVRRDPHDMAWASYCPNSRAIIALAALAEALN